jgi:hypothetical protein
VINRKNKALLHGLLTCKTSVKVVVVHVKTHEKGNRKWKNKSIYHVFSRDEQYITIIKKREKRHQRTFKT